MIAEHFVPQEFIAACWGLHLMCIGQAPSAAGAGAMEQFVFTYLEGKYMGIVDRSAHEVLPPIYAQTEGDESPTLEYLEGLFHEFQAVLASHEATSHHGTQLLANKPDGHTVGYAWQVNGEYHFMLEPEWTYRNQTDSKTNTLLYA
jgi:hypothetical protein